MAAFFHGLRITDLVFEVDGRTGKPAGNAYVEFATKEDYDGALALHMRHMGRRYIEVFPTTREDLNEARVKAGGGKIMPEPRRTFCVAVTGLPQTVNNRDLTSYFQEVNALPFAIHIMLKAQGVNAGEAFIEFLDPEHHRRALNRDGDVIANHRISVKNVDYEVMAPIVGKPIPPPVPYRPPMVTDMGRGRERMSRFDDRGRRSPPRRDVAQTTSRTIAVNNLAYKATNEDLLEFFRGFSVAHNGIERRMNDRGQATPEARVTFTSPEEANAALRQMHKKSLLGRQLFLRLD